MELLMKRSSYLFLCSFVIILGCTISQVSSADINTTTQITPPHCIWYGECRSYNYRTQNCPYDGPPKPMDEDGQQILKKWCPEFAGDGFKTCCDTAQVKRLDSNIRLLVHILRDTRCPSCMQNILKQICALTCSPEQSRFLNAKRVEIESNGTKYITEVDYYISNSYLSVTFDSCKYVSVPSTGQWALDLLCGSWGATQCTPLRWFSFMGDAADNPYVPFQINYINSSNPVNGFIPMNASVVPCILSTN